MRLRFTMGAATLMLVTGTAWGQSAAPPIRDFTNQPVTETVYATDQHMAFSIRTTLIRWLGGVDVSRERDVRAASKEGWWGESVPQVPREIVRSESQR